MVSEKAVAVKEEKYYGKIKIAELLSQLGGKDIT